MQFNIVFPAYMSRVMLVSFAILLPFLVSPEKDVPGRAKDTDSRHELYGTIYCGDRSIPLSGVEVMLYPALSNKPAHPSDTDTTDMEGTFKFNVVKDSSYILEIHGDLGTGRKYIPAGVHPGELEIDYPVVEKIVILHTNDQHFTLNNPREFARNVHEIRKKYKDVFLFSAGDIFVRHPLRWIVNGQLKLNPEWYGERAMYMIDNMNKFGYDLMTPGNHEFDYREPYTRQALDAARFPLVAANINILTEAFPPVKEFVVFNTSTWRNMTVIGLSRGNADGIEQLDINQTVDRLLYLRDSSDIFIALTHIGFRSDRALAERFPQFDVIIGGHSHDLLDDAILVNSVLVAQAGGNPHIISDNHPVYLGKIVVVLENGIITEKRGRIVNIEDTGIVTRTEKQLETEFFSDQHRSFLYMAIFLSLCASCNFRKAWKNI